MNRAMRNAERICEEQQLQLTPIRRRVLELILERHAPIGAYDILASLKKGEGALAPVTVYRALEFLLEAGLIHRIDALNAYLACESPHDSHVGQFLICRDCQRVMELDDDVISEIVAKRARAAGFTVQMDDIEIKGICDACHTRAKNKRV
ncbi:transcriptional repressor [Steroidobacter sp. S1-65]|uniref:Ferric uptake regulation protein n=2 Tax=Steroidobacter gossypii TaxID=2805490 RepID=A0ABS1WVG1_9GAMM|nr:transcriptional repressor [Steroidobacter gossypii]